MGAMASQITSLTIVYSTVIQAQIKENIKAPRHWLCAGNSPVTGEFSAQMASNAEKVSIWWRHHVPVNLTHIFLGCFIGTGTIVTHCFNSSPPSAAYMHQWIMSALAPSHYRNQCCLSIGPIGTNFSEIWMGILSFSFTKMHFKMSSVRMAAILSREGWINVSWVILNVMNECVTSNR